MRSAFSSKVIELVAERDVLHVVKMRIAAVSLSVSCMSTRQRTNEISVAINQDLLTI